jgi:hypothetical protein
MEICEHSGTTCRDRRAGGTDLDRGSAPVRSGTFLSRPGVLRAAALTGDRDGRLVGTQFAESPRLDCSMAG